MSAFNGYVGAKFHGGTMAGGPTFTVVHDAETPLRAGYCDSIVEFFRLGPKAGTSAHAMVDPVKAVKMLPDNVVAYAAGPKANPRGWHLEQAGYASFTRAQWTTPDGLAQVQRVGACLREIHDQWGIPKRWVTDAQLRAAALGDRAQGGITTHQQVARVLGGTTHTDPETNYPRDLLLQAVLGQEDDMPTADEVAQAVVNRIIIGNDTPLWLAIRQIHEAAQALPKTTADELFNRELPNAERDSADAKTTLSGQVQWADAHVDSVTKRLAVVEAKLDQVVNALLPPGKG